MGRKLNSSIHPKVYQNEKPIVREVDVMHFTVEGIDKPTIVKQKKKKHLTSLISKDSISAYLEKMNKNLSFIHQFELSITLSRPGAGQ